MKTVKVARKTKGATPSSQWSGPRNGRLIVCGFTHENQFQNGGRISSSLVITCKRVLEYKQHFSQRSLLVSRPWIRQKHRWLQNSKLKWWQTCTTGECKDIALCWVHNDHNATVILIEAAWLTMDEKKMLWPSFKIPCNFFSSYMITVAPLYCFIPHSSTSFDMKERGYRRGSNLA